MPLYLLLVEQWEPILQKPVLKAEDVDANLVVDFVADLAADVILTARVVAEE